MPSSAPAIRKTVRMDIISAKYCSMERSLDCSNYYGNGVVVNAVLREAKGEEHREQGDAKREKNRERLLCQS